MYTAGLLASHGVTKGTYPEFARYFEAGLPQTSICICGHPAFNHAPWTRSCQVACRCPNVNPVIDAKNPEYFFAEGVGPGPLHALSLSSLLHFERTGSLPRLALEDRRWNSKCYVCKKTTLDLDPCVLKRPRNEIVFAPRDGTVSKWICRGCSDLKSLVLPLQIILAGNMA